MRAAAFGIFATQPTFPIGQLSESQNAKMLGATQCPDSTITIVSIDDTVKCFSRQKVHDLSEQNFADIHHNLQQLKADRLHDLSITVQVRDIIRCSGGL